MKNLNQEDRNEILAMLAEMITETEQMMKVCHRMKRRARLIGRRIELGYYSSSF